jgi:cysteine-S-conjugate beta-lyase
VAHRYRPAPPGAGLTSAGPAGPRPAGDGRPAGEGRTEIDRELDVSAGWLRSKPGIKWRVTGAGELAAWVADMDFPAPPAVRRALEGLAAGGDLGYPSWLQDEGSPVREAFAARMSARYGWKPDPADAREFTDIIQGLQAVLFAATRPGDAVAMHVPAYPPFLSTLETMGRRLVPVPLEPAGHGGWSFDADRLARDVAGTGARAMVLVNPHNPSGRSFSRAELEAVAAIAGEQDLLVIADEVHADLTYPPGTHTPFGSLPGAAERTVTLTSATKAFNLAGIRCAVAHIGPAAVRSAFAQLPPLIFGAVSAPGVAATLAAWEHGDEWLEAVLRRLSANREIIARELGPLGIGYRPPEATYLAWLDFRGLDLAADPAAFLLEKAGVRLSPGPGFGPGGTGFARLNFATSEAVLTEICARIASAVRAAG